MVILFKYKHILIIIIIIIVSNESVAFNNDKNNKNYMVSIKVSSGEQNKTKIFAIKHKKGMFVPNNK